MLNALCFDIDDLAYGLHMKCGSALPSQYLVEKETYGLLEFLNTLNIKATMFVPGYVAESFPTLVRHMAKEGHEIGGHGHRHIDAEALQREEFRREIVVSKALLEDIISKEVSVYKDPCWGITPRTLWAYDELIEAGYSVDNTAQPALMKSFGCAPEEMTPYQYKGRLTVIPVTSITLFKKTMPLNGGLFSAYVPINMQIKYYTRLNSKGIPFNYYCHPYEVNPQGYNRYFWKRGSLRAGFYGLYFGKYRHYITILADHFRLAPLKDTYKDFIGLRVHYQSEERPASLSVAL